MRVEARDSVGNLITGFNGTATISDLTGTVNEGVANPPGPADVTIQFVNGVYNNGLGATLYVTGARVGDILTVTRGGISRDSGAFDVRPNVLNHFTVEKSGGGSIGAQAADTAFNIRVVAYDQYNNVLSFGPNAYDGAGDTVAISDSTGTIAPVVSGVFTAGVLDPQAGADNARAGRGDGDCERQRDLDVYGSVERVHRASGGAQPLHVHDAACGAVHSGSGDSGEDRGAGRVQQPVEWVHAGCGAERQHGDGGGGVAWSGDTVIAFSGGV